MKKLIITLLLITFIGIALAQPVDVIITFTIPAAKLADFRAGFLKAKPIQGNYTEKQWIKEVGRAYLVSIYEQGKQMIKDGIGTAAIAAAGIVIDPNVIQ